MCCTTSVYIRNAKGLSQTFVRKVSQNKCEKGRGIVGWFGYSQNLDCNSIIKKEKSDHYYWQNASKLNCVKLDNRKFY